MKRSRLITTVSTVAVAALASLLGSASALAVGPTFNAESYPATIDGVAEGSFTLSGGWGSAQCTDMDFSAEASAAVETLETETANGTCAGNPVAMNGCDFDFRPGSESGFGTFNGSFDIGPAGCGPITTQVGFCELSIYPKTGLSATYVNSVSEGRAVITAESHASGLKVVAKSVLGCSGGTFEDTSLSGEWLLSGSAAGGQVDIWAEQESHDPLFEAASYPAALTGSQDPAYKFTFTIDGNLEIVCDTADFSGELSEASTNAALTPTLAECGGGLGTNVEVRRNGCDLDQYAGTRIGFGEYFGTLGISCPSEGIEFYTPVCSVTLDPQSDLEATSYINGNSTVAIGNAIGGGVRYTKTHDGIFCPLAGTGTKEDGQLEVKINLSADKAIRVGG